MVRFTDKHITDFMSVDIDSKRRTTMPGYDDYFKMGKDFQDNLMKQYKEGLESIGKLYGMTDVMENFAKASGMDEKNNPVNAWYEAVKAYSPGEGSYDAYSKMMNYTWKTFQDQMTKFPELMKTWGAADMGSNFSMPTMMDIMSRMSESSAIYNQVFNFWKDFQDSMPLDTPEKIKAFTKKSEDLIAENVKTMMSTMLPPQFADLGGSYATLFENMNGTFKSFASPWLPDQAAMTDIIRRMMEGDSEAYSDYIRYVSDAYTNSFGKIFNLVGIGVNREDTEQQAQTLDSYMRLMFSYTELVSLILKIARKTSEALTQDYAAAMTDGSEPMDFKKFYSMWLKTNEQAFENFFASAEFTKAFNQFASDASQFKIKSDKLMEKMLAQIPVPTNTEMKSLYKTVYDLRKEVAALQKQVQELEKKAAAK